MLRIFLDNQDEYLLSYFISLETLRRNPRITKTGYYALMCETAQPPNFCYENIKEIKMLTRHGASNQRNLHYSL